MTNNTADSHAVEVSRSVSQSAQGGDARPPDDCKHEITRPGHAAVLFLWPAALGLPGMLWSLSRADYAIAAVILGLTALLTKGTWNVVKYERDTPLMRIEGGSLTWFGDIPKHRFTVDIATIRSWRIEYIGMRKNPFYQMTVRTNGGTTIERVLSPVAMSKSDDIYPLLEHYLAQRFTPPFQTPPP